MIFKNKKQILANILIIFVFIPIPSKLYAIRHISPTFGGPSGLYITPSAMAQPSISGAGGVHFLSRNSAIMPKLSVGGTPEWEIGAAGAINDTRDQDFFLIHTKYMFYNGSVKVAIGGNFQGGETKNAGQILLMGTWGSVANFEMSSAFGYTFAPNPIQPGSNLDFSLGFQRIIIPAAPWLVLIVDFSNYNYVFNWYSMSDDRALLIVGLRSKFNIGSNVFANIDVAGTDLADTSRGVAIGAYLGVKL